MKSSVLKLLSALAVLAVPTLASADYVCSVAQFPGNPTLAYRVRVVFSSSASCTGTTTTLWFCEKGVNSAQSSCVSDTLRFEKPELIEMYGQLVRAADSQQQVTRATSTCGDGSGSVTCGYYVDFSY